MSPIPRDKGPDSTLAFLSDGYQFISKRCQRYQSDLFETRILFQKAVCAMGEEAARMFYHPDRFTRRGAVPFSALMLLQDKTSVAVLDGDVHRHRKQMFLALMNPEAVRQLADMTADEWQAAAGRWEGLREVVLHDEVLEILCHAVCRWSGVPLAEAEAKQRTREFAAMIDGAGSLGPRNWWGQLLRARTERWIRDVIVRVRAGRLHVPEGSAVHAVAFHRDHERKLLDPTVAGVELINVLRPTVAVGWYITFAALALHEHPEWRERLQAGEGEAERFAQEVRRFYPFFPAVAGRVLEEFEWKGHPFARGDWVILDLYGTNHDPRIWEDPEAFRPDRFLNWDGSPFNFIPHGGGAPDGHRCPGEPIAVELIKTAARQLAAGMRYDVPPQDLRVNLSRIPTLPKSRMVIQNVRRNERPVAVHAGRDSFRPETAGTE